MKNFKRLPSLILALLLAAPIAFAVGCGDGGGEGGGGDTDINLGMNGYLPLPKEETTIICDDFLSGDGTDFNRYECVEDTYYEIELSTSKEIWLSFAVSETGQYALYTVEEAVGKAQIIRYDASIQYIPSDDDGNYIGEEALQLRDNRLYSLVNCSDDYFSRQWRATFGIKGLQTGSVRVRLVRVGDPINRPVPIRYSIEAKEIVGVAKTPQNTLPFVVPYEKGYYYDETYEMTFTTPIGANGNTQTGSATATGFYRMCDVDENGDLIKTDNDPVIYAAVDAVPTRLFDTTFSLAQDKGNALSLSCGTDETTGNPIVHEYIDFITNDNGGNKAEDLTKACYANAANEEGMYPVNKELFQFLNEYVAVNPPYMEDGDEVDDDKLWLAACYYYKQAKRGSVDFPIELTLGTQTIDIDQAYTHIYHKLKWHGDDDKNTGYYTIVSNDDNAYMVLDEKQYAGKFSVTIEVDKADGKTFMLSYGTTAETAGKTGTYQLTVTESTGMYSNPNTLTKLGDVTLQTQNVHTLDGKIMYMSVYQYTAQSKGGTVEITPVEGVTFTFVGGASENGVVSSFIDEETGEEKIMFSILVISQTADDVITNITFDVDDDFTPDYPGM